MQFKLEVTFEMLDCSLCGLQYAVPHDWADRRRKDQQTFRCPNGHKQMFGSRADQDDDEKSSKQETERRRELVLALHRAEQAEARAADGKAAAESTDEQPERQRRKWSGTDKCPVCEKTYKVAKCLGNHLRREHRVDPETLNPLPAAGKGER